MDAELHVALGAGQVGYHLADDRRFRERFDIAPTDVDQAAAHTVQWAKQHYGWPGTPDQIRRMLA